MIDDFDIVQAQRLQDLRDIDIVIDTWDDIFSDFDPRPLSMRSVSTDFMEELKRRYRETRTGNFIVTIRLPLSLKNADSERMVVQRLKKHFYHRFLQKKKELQGIRLRGIIFLVVGVCSLSFLTLATYFKFINNLSIEIASIILMPLGWFGFWEGLSKFVNTSPEFKYDARLFEKLSKAGYCFKYIGEERN